MDDETKVRIGAWILSLGKIAAGPHGDKLAESDFESIILAGSGARFFSAIRTLEEVSARREEGFRLTYELSRPELSSAISVLDALGLLSVNPKAKDEQTKLHVKPSTREDVYRAASALFEHFEPSDCARVAIGILDATAYFPQKRDQLISSIVTGLGVDETIVARALKHLEVIGAIQFTHETLGAEPLVYNPIRFQYKDEDAARALNALNPRQKEIALGIIEFVSKNPGVPVPPSMRGQVYEVLKKAGVIDVSVFAPRSGMSAHEFPTLPAAWGTVVSSQPSKGAGADLVDDAKALLTSLRYGEHFSTISGGRIKDPFVLLRALVRRGVIGPATNIGTDHMLIVRRGIVDIVENPALPGRYSMELRKAEIAEPVLQMLSGEGGTVLDTFPDDVPGEPDQPYQAPETVRAVALKAELLEMRDAIIFESLRR